MPATEVVFYRDESGAAPVLDWLRELRDTNRKAFANCVARVRLLRALGHELRRPHVDYLRDGIYELRAKEQTVQYRILFFYHGRNVAVLAHSLTKKKTVPAADIDRAVERKVLYEKNPFKHKATQDVTGNTEDL